MRQGIVRNFVLLVCLVSRQVYSQTPGSTVTHATDGAQLVFPIEEGLDYHSIAPLDSEGNRFVAVIEEKSPRSGNKHGLYLCDLDDQSQTLVLMENQKYRPHSILCVSRDGKHAAVHLRDEESKKYWVIAVLELEPPYKMEIVEGSQGAGSIGSWDEEGNLLFSVSDKEKGTACLYWRPTGTNKAELFFESDGDYVGDPSVSVDGRYVYFVALSKKKSLQKSIGYMIKRLDRETNTITEICRGYEPELLPDGKRLAYMKRTENSGGSKKREIYLQDLVTGESVQLTDYDITKRESMSPRVAPDGRSLYFLASPPGDSEFARFPYVVDISTDPKDKKDNPINLAEQKRIAWQEARERDSEIRKDERAATDAHERVAGFVRLWSEVKYNFAFFDQVPELDWDNVLDEYLPKVQQAKTWKEYYLLLERCIAILNGGHMTVYPAYSLRD